MRLEIYQQQYCMYNSRLFGEVFARRNYYNVPGTVEDKLTEIRFSKVNLQNCVRRLIINETVNEITA